MREDDEIEASRLRIANGIGTALDHYRMRVLQRRERAAEERAPPPTDTVFIEANPAIDSNGIIDEQLADAIGYAIGTKASQLRREFRAANEHVITTVAAMIHDWASNQARENERVRDLEIQVAELRAALNMSRRAVDDDRANVIDLPAAWRPNKAARS